MNALLRSVAVGVMIAGLSACASTRNQVATSPKVVPQHQTGMLVVDSQYVSYVERTARTRGVDVKWVNPPLRRVTGTSQ